MPIPCRRNIGGRPFRGMEGGAPEESSEITKAGIIDGLFSIHLPWFALLRSMRAIESKEDLFSVYTFFIFLLNHFADDTFYDAHFIVYDIGDCSSRAEEMLFKSWFVF